MGSRFRETLRTLPSSWKLKESGVDNMEARRETYVLQCKPKIGLMQPGKHRRYEYLLFESDKLRDSLPGSGSGSHRHCIRHWSGATFWKPTLFMSTRFTSPSQPRSRAEIQIELKLTITAFVVTIKGVACEEDLERIRPRKPSSLNCPISQDDKSMLQRHIDSVHQKENTT